MISTPEIISLGEQRTAFIPLCIARERMPELMGPAVAELIAALQAQGLAPAGPLLCHHHRLDSAVFDFALSFPVLGAVQPQGRVQAGVLPAARVVRTVYQGAYEGLPQAWGEFTRWLQGSGQLCAEDFLEIYLQGPAQSPNPADWRTELRRPLRD